MALAVLGSVVLLAAGGAPIRAGELDTRFGNGGTVVTGIEGSAAAVVAQPGGKLVVGGTGRSSATLSDFTLARFTRDGVADPSFGEGGTVSMDIGQGYEELVDLVQQRDGRLVAAGKSRTVGPPDRPFLGVERLAVARFTPDGALDPSFGTGGVTVTDLGPGFHSGGWAGAVAVQRDGKVVVAGAANGADPLVRHVVLVRYRPDGSLDPTFGTGGIVTTPVHGGRAHPWDLVVGRNGALTVAGGLSTELSDTSAPSDMLLVRYDRTGRLDPSFGQGGIVTTNLGSVTNVATALVQLPDGRVVAAGYSGDTFAGRGDFAVVRYRPDGSLDRTFGGDGAVTTDIEGGNDRAHAVLLQPDGQVVVAGYTQLVASHPTQPFDYALARYRRDGSLDRSFGQSGWVRTDVGGSLDRATAVTQPSPRTIVAVGGTAYSGQSMTFSLARYHTGPRPS